MGRRTSLLGLRGGDAAGLWDERGQASVGNSVLLAIVLMGLCFLATLPLNFSLYSLQCVVTI